MGLGDALAQGQHLQVAGPGAPVLSRVHLSFTSYKPITARLTSWPLALQPGRPLAQLAPD